MSRRSPQVVAPQSGSRLDNVLRAGLSIRTNTPKGRYVLDGNQNSDSAILYFNNYDEYMKKWHEWDQKGWLHPRNRKPLDRNGERDLSQSPPLKYSFMTNDYKEHVFDDYDEYLLEWQAAVDNKTIFDKLSRNTRDGGVEIFRNRQWRRVPYAR